MYLEELDQGKEGELRGEKKGIGREEGEKREEGDREKGFKLFTSVAFC